jgi:hypothetical protein
MQKFVDEIQTLRARQAEGVGNATVAKTSDAATLEPEADGAESHLFINAYTRGKPH